jgi:DNA-binding GntR family transcriptional regulator
MSFEMERIMRKHELELKTLGNMAYDVIKGFILKNEMLPGQEVVINSIAASLGVSHIPVREAVARLAADGLIEQTPHRTLRVASLSEADVHQIYEVRRLLEPYVASCVAAKASHDAQLHKSLSDLLKRAKLIIEEKHNGVPLEEFFAVDIRLNEILLDAVENTIFREILTFVGNRSLRIRTYAEASTSPAPDTIRLITLEHISIINAILEGQAERSRELVLEHLRNGENRTTVAVRSRTTASK